MTALSMMRQSHGKRQSHCLTSKIYRKLKKWVKYSNRLRNRLSLTIQIWCLFSNGNKLCRHLRKGNKIRRLKCYFKWTMIFIFWDSCFSMGRISYKILPGRQLLKCWKKCFPFKRQTSCNKCFSRWLVKQLKLKQVNC